MSDIYAGEQGAYDTTNKRLLAEENKLKMADMMRVRDEEAAARAIKTRIANQALEDQTRAQYVPPEIGQGQGLVPEMPSSDVPGDLVPQGMIPQEGLTGLGGMSTPQQGPMGMQPQEGATGLGGMQPTGMTPEQMPVEQPQQQQAPAPGTLMSNLEKAEQVYSQAQAQVNQVKQIETELRKAGLHDEADKYVNNTLKQQEAASKAQKAHIEAKEKALEYIGRSAKGFLEADDDPATDSNAAWQRLVLDAAANGIDPTEMLSIDPSQRRAYATYHYEQAKELKDQVGLEKTMLNIADRQDRATKANETRKEIANMVDASRAKNRELTQTRWEKQFGLSVYKTQEKAIRDNIGFDLNKTREMDSQIRAVQKEIDDINSLRNLSVKKSERPAVIAELEARKGQLVMSRDSLLDNVNSYQSSLQTMQKSFANAGYKAKDLENVSESAAPSSVQAAPSASPAAALQAQPNSKIPANFKSEQEEALSYWKTKSPAAQAQIEETFKKSTGFDLFERGAAPTAETKTESAKPAKPQTEAERREQILLDKLNEGTLPMSFGELGRSIQGLGETIMSPFEAGEKYFQEKRDTYNKNIDIAASVAKEKLKDKAFLSKLNPKQLERLNEIASDSGAKNKAYQDSDTPYDALPLAGFSSLVAKSASDILKGGSRLVAAKAVKDATRTPSDIETNMAGLQDRLKRVEEIERSKKLRSIGDSDKETLRQIKEEIRLIDQANENALKQSEQAAKTTEARKLARQQRDRMNSIKKEIKRVFEIATGSSVPYKKPDFDGGQVSFKKPEFN